MESNSGYWLTRLLLQRGLGFIYLIVFLVAVNQFRPLCGEKGLLPISRFIQFTSFRETPSIFFFFPKDIAFAFFGWCGVLLAILAVTGLSERVAVLRWQRLIWFHLPAVIWGGSIELLGWVCPLTNLENCFRRLGGESCYRVTSNSIWSRFSIRLA